MVPALQYISVLLISAVADANVKLLLISSISSVSSDTVNLFESGWFDDDVPFIT